MYILELFSGTGSFSKEAEKRGHKVFTIDNNPIFKPNLCIDILEFNIDMLPEEFKKPEIIWASPPCQKFSVMTIGKNWNKDENGKYHPKTEGALNSIKIVKKTLEIIKTLKPKFFIIENPRAMLRKQDFMAFLKRDTITYCKYGFDYQKATDLWNNLINWFPITPCKANNPCHIRAPRGSRLGVQGIQGFKKNREQKHLDISRINGHRDFSKDNRDTLTGNALRGIVPPLLCNEILDYCEANNDI